MNVWILTNDNDKNINDIWSLTNDNGHMEFNQWTSGMEFNLVWNLVNERLDFNQWQWTYGFNQCVWTLTNDNGHMEFNQWQWQAHERLYFNQKEIAQSMVMLIYVDFNHINNVW